MAENPKTFDTGLSREQLAEAFRRALNDLTDDEISALLAEKADKAEVASLEERVEALEAAGQDEEESGE